MPADQHALRLVDDRPGVGGLAKLVDLLMGGVELAVLALVSRDLDTSAAMDVERASGAVLHRASMSRGAPGTVSVTLT